jgi:hypothetical protein
MFPDKARLRRCWPRLPQSPACRSRLNLIWRLRFGRGSMLCAPILHSLGIDSLIRTNNAIDGMTLKQLRTGILKRCFSGRLTTSYVALIDCTMQHPFRHFFSRSPRTIHGSIPIHGDWHSDRWHPKRKTPPLYATRGEVPAPFFFVRECRGPWR